MFLHVCLLSAFLLNFYADAVHNPYCNITCGNMKHACCKFQKSQPGPRCKPPYEYHPMSDEDRELVLMMHNSIRNNIASGTDPFLPQPSSNMHVLTYDLELEFLASCWVTQCRKKQYGCLDSKKGQTAHHVWQDKERKAPGSTGKKLLTYSLYNFYKQLELINMETVKSFKSDNLPSPLLLLSQVIWANTQYVGCARVTFGSDQRRYRAVNVVCVYYPKGNVDLQPIYKTGKPCSDCPEGTHCHNNYTSLCTPYLKRSLDTFKTPFVINKSRSSPKVCNNLYLLLIMLSFVLVLVE